MKGFILAILHEWHVFSQTKLVTLFRNVFILYNFHLEKDFKELVTVYGINNPSEYVTLYNDLNRAKKSTNVLYLHKCSIYKSQLQVFMKGLEDKEYTYEEAYHKLQALYALNSTGTRTEDSLKEKKIASYVANRGGDEGTDPDGCVIYHSDRKWLPSDPPKTPK